MKAEQQWHWQEPGRAWKGIGVYHITLTVPSREPLLGTLDVPDNAPQLARVVRTALGNAVVDELYAMCRHYPAVRILQFCLMPDHLHAIVHVTQPMATSIRSVVRGYWQGVKKLGRAYTLSLDASPSPSPFNPSPATASLPSAAAPSRSAAALLPSAAALLPSAAASPSSIVAEFNSASTNEGYQVPGATVEGAYPFPVFTERPFIRPLSRRGQLDAMIRYVQMNPQRLATKRLHPGFFRVQSDIVIGSRRYDGVGNVALLTAPAYAPVHVRHATVELARHGHDQELRDYKNGCVLQARQGTVMVSPFISPDEKQVMQVLLKEQHPFVLLADNGFRDYYKPADMLFDACAAGRLLILSPWPYDSGKRHVSRADCMALNAMAEEICHRLMGHGA